MPTLTALTLYPIKSCAGVALQAATLTAAGLMHQQVHDREWMVVDAAGEFLSQRSYPRMALITPRIEADTLVLQAPQMPVLALPLQQDDASATRQVRVWDDTLDASDCGEAAALWFSQALATPCRLVRFHPAATRSASTRWTDGKRAPTRFSDGFPLLLVSEASLADLNDKLQAQGRAALPMNRFRPNLVLGGVDAFEEDYTAPFAIGDALLKPVKPCPRCPMPAVDQATGRIGPDPMDILQTYRANPKVDGGITFGMNTIVLEGAGQALHVGQQVSLELAF